MGRNNCSFYDMDVLLLAHVLEYLRPHSGTDLPNVSLLEQKHEDARLARRH